MTVNMDFVKAFLTDKHYTTMIAILFTLGAMIAVKTGDWAVAMILAVAGITLFVVSVRVARERVDRDNARAARAKAGELNE